MTTIACNRSMIAADSLVRCSGQRDYFTSKLCREGDSIFGACGDTPPIARFLRWVEAGQPVGLEPTFEDGDDFSAVELRADGIYVWDKGLRPDKLLDVDQNYAVGSIGAGVALYCMRILCYTPALAVRDACMVDVESGGRIQWMMLNGEEGYL